jgi:hypothetical protein
MAQSKPKYMKDDDLELLGELGVEIAPEPSGQRSAKEEWIIAGFEEIERFAVVMPSSRNHCHQYVKSTKPLKVREDEPQP